MLQVAEMGTHAQLVEEGGLYAEMWRRQQETSAVDKAGSSAPSSRVASSAALAEDGKASS